MQTQIMYFSKFVLRKNNNPEKPIEDYILVDDKTGIYIVCDGVTRSLVNGVYPQESPAAQASKLFAERVKEVLVDFLVCVPPQNALKLAITEGNKTIRLLNESKFPYPDYLENDLAGTVSIIGIVKENQFFYAYNGDCCGYLINRKRIIKFTFPQTLWVAEYRKEVGFSEEATLRIRKEFRNNKQSNFGYGVFTGEKSALDFIEYGCISIIPEQTIILSSDGITHLFDTNPKMLFETSLNKIIDEAEKLERKFDLRSDDKAIISIRFI